MFVRVGIMTGMADTKTIAQYPIDFEWVQMKAGEPVGSIKNIDGIEVVFYQDKELGRSGTLVAVNEEFETACNTDIFELGEIVDIDEVPRIVNGCFKCLD
jgi:hypothetical protein